MKCQFITPIFLLGILNVLSCIPPLVLAEENKELSKRGVSVIYYYESIEIIVELLV
jgi:hypothetical protein